VWGCGQQRRHPGRGRQDVLEIVQDQESAAGSQICGDSVARGSGADFLEVESMRDRGIDVGGIPERHQFDKPSAIGEGCLDAAGRREGKPGLANASRARQG
jgi:hypothetical protein